jgi:hypothetical protein
MRPSAAGMIGELISMERGWIDARRITVVHTGASALAAQMDTEIGP